MASHASKARRPIKTQQGPRQLWLGIMSDIAGALLSRSAKS